MVKLSNWLSKQVVVYNLVNSKSHELLLYLKEFSINFFSAVGLSVKVFKLRL